MRFRLSKYSIFQTILLTGRYEFLIHFCAFQVIPHTFWLDRCGNWTLNHVCIDCSVVVCMCMCG